MNDTRGTKDSICFALHCVVVGLMLCIGGTFANPACKNRVDIVIAVDTTSSQSVSTFEDVKAKTKSIVAGFTIGPDHTRLALISISDEANVIANFDTVSSLADFDKAVEKLTFSSEKAKLSEGIKVAKNSVMNNARTKQVKKALVLVKDRRSERSADNTELLLIALQAADIKSSGVAVHAVGVGGLWSTMELESLFKSEYLLFKNKNGLDSIKSLSNLVCEANCPRKGEKSKKDGLCYDKTRHAISTTVELATNLAQLSVCRTETIRSFENCNVKNVCNFVDRRVSSCGTDNKVKISTSWQMFDYKLQSCVTLSTEIEADCADAWKCKDQVADLIFILDRSGSMWIKREDGGRNHFIDVKAATLEMAKALNIGPKNVRVGVTIFGTEFQTIFPLGSIEDRIDVLEAIKNVPLMDENDFSATYTDKAFAEARRIFKSHGRKDVAKFIILLTDGRSSDGKSTLKESKLLKDEGVTITAIGIGPLIVASELQAITAPESDTNMFILTDFKTLITWTDEFTKKMCIRMTAPNPKLCDDKVFFQHVTDCQDGKQTVTRTEFKYTYDKNCIKTIQTTVHKTCKAVCRDPIDGNVYLEGNTWTNLCHEFRCTKNPSKPFIPVRSNCLAADGTCIDVSSTPFRCVHPIDGVETDNCVCINKNGAAVLIIDTE